MIRKAFSFVTLSLMSAFLIAVPLRVLHTNDTHGAYQPRSYGSGENARLLGGYVALEAHLSRLRAEVSRSIYLDAGDQQTGTVFAALEHNGAIGGAVIEVFNHLALDATTYGNHEFDYSLDNLRRLTKLANYSFVSTNVIVSRTALPFGDKPTHIIKLDSLKVGIMGLTLTDLAEKVKIENVRELFVKEYTYAINEYLDELDSKTDLIILLTHNGFEADSLLATMLDDRVDIIIGGHTHTYISQPKQVNGIYILQAGS
ncbi:MAG: metallophosphoesterase, partial [Candidatus Cloacimonadaceae bacterium]|nr:metallophosphoesterase [Candidatus Cloacimonadaceae bacterium]